MADIFSLFPKSIDTVSVKKITRGTLDISTVYQHDLDCIVKRRSGADTGANDSELYKNSTTIHFKPADSQYVEIGNYVKIDGVWRDITFIKVGKDFDTGDIAFLWATVGNEILDEPTSPDWSTISA